MKLPPVPLFALVMTFGSLPDRSRAADLSPARLRTEHRADPQGIGARRPRLSWIVESKKRNQKQTAYRVLVASNAADLERDSGDLWDSGKVESSETARIEYAGQPLKSGMACHWKVTVWDRAGRVSPWSAAARWSMGLLEPADWKAQWIGFDRPAQGGGAAAGLLDGARWIWFPEGDPAAAAPAGSRFFRKTFELAAGGKIARAELAVAADNEAAIFVNGARAGKAGSFSSAVLLDIAGLLRPGANTLAILARNAGDKPNPAGLLAALRISTGAGEAAVVATDGTWLASDREQAGWEQPAFETSAWAASKVLGASGMAPWGKVSAAELKLPPPRYLRKAFRLDKPVRRAVAYASALGIYQLSFNGRRAGDDYFTPGWTDYDKRVYYNAYDVTGLLSGGDNAMGAILADGWYAGYLGFGGGRDSYGSRIRFLARLDVEYTDGTSAAVVTGPDWQASTGGLLEADFLMGESFDSGKEPVGWDTAAFDASGWSAPDIGEPPAAKVEAHPGPAVRELDPVAPVAVTQPQPGKFVFDLGQNFAGVVRLRVREPAGTALTLRYAEMLSPGGAIYTENLRSARATDRYVCRGGGEEVWQPRFTFHGFRYVELAGCSAPPSRTAVTGIPLSSDTPVAGRFECSNDLVNRLFSNIYWTQRMNFIDIPTDCPQRDERLGWTGDAQIYCRTACRITDNQAFFTKWLVDLEDAQRRDGQFPMVAPLKSKGVSADGGPAWADAGVICPWTVYQMYGDRDLLERHYDSMRRFIDFCKARSTQELLPPANFHCFGDWLSIRADTPKEIIYTAYFAGSTRLLARAAAVLGKEDDARTYGELYEKIKAAFNRAYVSEDGRILGNTQTGYVLAIANDLLDAGKQKLAAQHLIEDMRGRDWHLSTGFIGTKDLMLALNKIDRTDVAYRLLLNTTFPSWGFSIRQGATTIWERWNGWTPEEGFFEPSMNSFAHYSFGAVGQWLFETAGGIDTDGPGFQKIIIRPRPGGGLRWAKSHYRSVAGDIECRWEIDGDVFKLAVLVPANAAATVHVPAADAARVTEGGKPVAEVEAVRALGVEGGAAVFAVPSGEYRFAAPVR